MTIQEQFVNELTEWVGTPHHSNENKKQIGCDCVGMIVGALREIGLHDYFSIDDVILTRTYKAGITSSVVLGFMGRNFDRIAPTDAITGDLLILKYSERVQHIAVLMKGNTLIHSCDRLKKVVIEKYSKGWRTRTVGVYRLRTN